MAPIVHGFAEKYRGKINFVYLDIDDPKNDGFKQELGYRVQPHIFLLDGDGTILKQWLGRVSAEEFENTFKDVLE